MVESGVDACASDTRASGGDCVGRFSQVLKCSCHLAATDALSDSSFPFRAFNGAEVAIYDTFNVQSKTEASQLSLQTENLTKKLTQNKPMRMINPVQSNDPQRQSKRISAAKLMGL